MKLHDNLLWVAAALAFCIAVALLYFRLYLSSDTLYLEDLSRDLFHFGGAWRDWRFSPAPAYLPDLPLYFIAYFLIPAYLGRIMFVSACQAILLALAAIWLGRKIQPSLSTPARVLILLLVTAVTLVSSQSGMWLYFYTTNNHFASLLFGLTTIGLLISYLENPNIAAGAGIVASCAAGLISTSISLISFFLPTLTLLGLALFLAMRDDNPLTPFKRRIGVALGLCVAGFEVAKLGDRLITFNDPLAATVPVTIKSAARAFAYFLEALAVVFDPANAFTLVLSVMVVASFGFLALLLLCGVTLRKKFSGGEATQLALGFDSDAGDWRLTAAGSFLVIGSVINFLGGVLSGGIHDANCLRYFTMPIALALLLAVIALDRRAVAHATRTGYAAAWALSLAAIAGGFLLWQKADKSEAAVAARALYREAEIAACIKKLREKGVPLNSGLADYNHSRGVALQLPEDMAVVTVGDDLAPLFWMSTIGVFTHPELYPPRFYNFVILRDSANSMEAQEIDLNKIKRLVPKNYTLHPCHAGQAQIMAFPGAELNNVFLDIKKFHLFAVGKTDEIVFAPRELGGEIGHLEQGAQVATNADGDGLLTAGPYRDLWPGRYRVELSYDAQADDGAPVGSWEIGFFGKPPRKISLFSGDLAPAENGVAKATIELPPGGLKSVEFRVSYTGRGRLSVHSIKLFGLNP